MQPEDAESLLDQHFGREHGPAPPRVMGASRPAPAVASPRDEKQTSDKKHDAIQPEFF